MVVCSGSAGGCGKVVAGRGGIKTREVCKVYLTCLRIVEMRRKVVKQVLVDSLAHRLPGNVGVEVSWLLVLACK